jgi:hypothetical protein
MKRLRRIANYLFLATFLANSAHAQGTGLREPFLPLKEALIAFIRAVRDGNPSELGAILGPGTEQVVASNDSVADKTSRETFLKWYGQSHFLVPSGKGEFTLQVGKDGWPLPIPLAHSGDKWYCDGIRVETADSPHAGRWCSGLDSLGKLAALFACRPRISHFLRLRTLSGPGGLLRLCKAAPEAVRTH